MTTAIEAANTRHLKDTALVVRLATEARQCAGQARVHHPAGFVEIDRQLRDGLVRASAFPPSGEQLLAIEQLHADMQARVLEADAEIERLRESHRRRNLEAQKEASRRNGHRQWNDRTVGPMRRAIDALSESLDRIAISSGCIENDAEYLEALAGVEDALRPIGNMVGLERRAARLRDAAQRAEAAVDHFAAKAA